MHADEKFCRAQYMKTVAIKFLLLYAKALLINKVCIRKQRKYGPFKPRNDNVRRLCL